MPPYHEVAANAACAALDRAMKQGFQKARIEIKMVPWLTNLAPDKAGWRIIARQDGWRIVTWAVYHEAKKGTGDDLNKIYLHRVNRLLVGSFAWSYNEHALITSNHQYSCTMERGTPGPTENALMAFTAATELKRDVLHERLVRYYGR